MIRIYHSRRARSARVIWLCEELGVPYEIEKLEFTPDALKSPEYLSVHPLGQIPAIVDGDVRMFESGAIIDYLLVKYGKGRLVPRQDSPEWPLYLQWFHYGEAAIAQTVGHIVKNRFGSPPEARVPEVVEYARRRLRDVLAVAERALDGREYVLGAEFTAADIMMSYGMIMARIIGDLPPDSPNVAAYIERLKQRPAYAVAWA